MNTSSTEEKRQSPRINTKCPTRYQIKRGGFFASALTEDLSLLGVRLNADRFFPLGINLKIELNILSKVINPIGRVVWSQPLSHSDRYQMGIQFIEINPQDRNFLSEYINTHVPEFSDTEK